MIKQAAA